MPPDQTETPKRDFRQEVTDQIIEMLEKGTAPWQKPWEAGCPPTPLQPNHRQELPRRQRAPPDGRRRPKRATTTHAG